MNDPVVSQTAPFLLTTKLHRPRSAAVELPRLRLLQQLSAGLHHPLTLIAAPAGYGKTTLINQWLDVVDLPYAWLSLDESDGDPATFLAYVLAAIRTVYPHTDSATELLLKAPDLPSPPRLADSLLRDLARLPGALLLVLEDYHFIQTLAVHAIMTELVQHLPPHVHLALTTRVDPPWPLERLRGRQQLVEIRSADLRFTLDEATQLLSQLLGPAAADETATLLEEANEGWAIGLQLAALALRGRDDPAAIARSIAGGSHQLIIDYLLAEVLQGLPDDQRAFLLETSLLDRFCAPLYDALWDERRPFMIDDGAKRVTGNDMLRAVRRANLFLVPLDPEGVWFRYHHLFTNLLRIRLQQLYTQEQIRDLHARAAAWFVAHALEDEAIAHFLRAGDAPSAAALIEERVHSLLDQENWRQLERWLAQLPAEARQLPALLTAQAALHFLHYRFALIGPLLDAAEAAIAQQPAREPTTLTPLQGEIARLRACIAFNDDDADAMLHWAGIARAKLRPEMQYAMGLADFFFICGLHASGRYAEAVAFAHQQLDAAGQYPALALRILLALCSIYYDRADVPALQRSGATLQQVARRADLTTSLAWSYEIQGWLHYQRNELAAAEASLRSLVAIAPLAHGRALLDGFTGLTLIHLAQDEPEQAYDTVTTLRTHLLERSMLVLLPVADALQQRVQLHSGPPTSLHRHYQAPQHFPIVFWEQPALMQARMLLACGAAHDLAEATVLLADARARAAERHSPRVQIEACALAALVYAAQGDEAAALGALQEAVEMAAPGGALRLLADCGPGLAGLLHKLLDAGVAPTYVRQVLAVLGASPQEPPVPPPAPSAAQPQALAETTLAETLTNREVDVLILLAQRLSDKEIAERLFLAPGTIKKHANNIYRKLDVHNRREAAAYARRLGLH